MATNDLFEFQLVSENELITSSRNCAYLRISNWDDWFRFSTTYELIVYDEEGQCKELGNVKIGQTDMKGDQRRPELPCRFSKLDEPFFSLGQSDGYYERLGSLSSYLKNRIVQGLRDVVANQDIWEKIKTLEVTELSLTRHVSLNSIKGQYRRLLNGGARLSEYRFSFTPPRASNTISTDVTFDFHVRPESNPPTNIHVLIGRNGVGKTTMLDQMTRALIANEGDADEYGRFSWHDDLVELSWGTDPLISEPESPFSSVVTVSFSAFDGTDIIPEQTIASKELKYYYIGLRENSASQTNFGKPKSPSLLTKEFVNSVKCCINGPRLARWKRALEMLEADPLFTESEVTRLAEINCQNELSARSEQLFRDLSSGHKIVLLTISRLVEVVEEKTIVLIDEPEVHLHPPLLSAFVRSLSDLLINRNGVAIIATHSPVVLQEVPRTCVSILQRSGQVVRTERPECETFGENVGVLTREVFRLEVTQTGFHRLLLEEVSKGSTFDEICKLFNDELGAEARAMLRALIATRKNKSNP